MRTKDGSYPAHAPAKAARLKQDAPKPARRPSSVVDTRVIYCGDNLEQPASLQKRQNTIPGWNALILREKDYASALAMVEHVRSRGLKPDVATYSILIKKAPDLPTGLQLLDAMRKEGLKPNVVTYNTLIDKATFDEGKKLVKAMRKEGLKPNVRTYSTLIDKASYADGRELLKEMHNGGVRRMNFLMETYSKRIYQNLQTNFLNGMWMNLIIPNLL